MPENIESNFWPKSVTYILFLKFNQGQKRVVLYK